MSRTRTAAQRRHRREGILGATMILGTLVLVGVSLALAFSSYYL